jgi:hypothetical protein
VAKEELWKEQQREKAEEHGSDWRPQDGDSDFDEG